MICPLMADANFGTGYRDCAATFCAMHDADHACCCVVTAAKSLAQLAAEAREGASRARVRRINDANGTAPLTNCSCGRPFPLVPVSLNRPVEYECLCGLRYTWAQVLAGRQPDATGGN